MASGIVDINAGIVYADMTQGNGDVHAFLRAAVVIPSDADYTVLAAAYQGRHLDVTSGVSLTVTRKLILPLTAGGEWQVTNSTTGSQTLQVIGSSGTGILLMNGKRLTVRTDGTNFYVMDTDTAAMGAYPDGTGTISVAGAVDVTPTLLQLQYRVIILNGAITANINLIVPASMTDRIYVNATTGAHTLSIKTGASAVAIAQNNQAQMFTTTTVNRVTADIAYTP